MRRAFTNAFSVRAPPSACPRRGLDFCSVRLAAAKKSFTRKAGSCVRASGASIQNASAGDAYRQSCVADMRRRWNQSAHTDAADLAAAVAAARRKGRRVYWRTSSPICFEPTFVTNWGMATHELNAMLRYSDRLVSTAMRARSVPTISLRAIDRDVLRCGRAAASSGGGALELSLRQLQPEKNETAMTACRCQGYGMDSTHLHPAPATAAAQVERLLRAASCTAPPTPRRSRTSPGVAKGTS